MNRRISAQGMALCLGVAMVLVLAAGCRPEGKREAQGGALPLTLAVQPAPYSGLIAVADEKGFFKQAGVEVTMKRYPSGRDSLKAMMAGEAQVATIADIAFASTMEEDRSLRVIAAIGASTGSQLVARTDRNIREPADLKGKRIGYSPGTSSPYFLHSFLLMHHMSEKDVTMAAVPPARQVEAIVGGEVDAVSAFDVYAYTAKKELGPKAVAWDVQNTLDYQWLLVTKEKETQSPEAIKRLLRALVLAEEFAVGHQEETRGIVAREWNIDPEYIRESWKRTRLFVSFNQSIIAGIQSYAKWKARSEGGTNTVADVRAYVETGPLEGVDPKFVTIFR